MNATSIYTYMYYNDYFIEQIWMLRTTKNKRPLLSIIAKYGFTITEWAWLYQALWGVCEQNSIVNKCKCPCTWLDNWTTNVSNKPLIGTISLSKIINTKQLWIPRTIQKGSSSLKIWFNNWMKRQEGAKIGKHKY